MIYYYTVLQSKSHSLILQHRMRTQNIECELVYLPREIMKDLCNMGVRFEERYLKGALDVIRQSGLPGCKVYMELVNPNSNKYVEIPI